jgi:hypothetical protein
MASSLSFVMAVKSTIDKIASDAATELGCAVIDLDNAVNIQELVNSPDPAIITRFMSLDEDPIDPLWTVQFYIGAKTAQDPGNYALIQMIESFRSLIRKGSYIDCYDYSGVTASSNKVGLATVADCTVEPHMFEGMAGVRLYQVRARIINTTMERVGTSVSQGS